METRDGKSFAVSKRGDPSRNQQLGGFNTMDLRDRSHRVDPPADTVAMVAVEHAAWTIIQDIQNGATAEDILEKLLDCWGEPPEDFDPDYTGTEEEKEEPEVETEDAECTVSCGINTQVGGDHAHCSCTVCHPNTLPAIAPSRVRRKKEQAKEE